ncbi:MAG TPA: nucleotide exchange factor GrpE [Verrucomicrobiae bacterium]
MNTETNNLEADLETESVPENSDATQGKPVSEADLLQLKADAAKAREHWEQLLRTAADFENYKKRANRERLDATRFANESLLLKLLPVLDNFEKALEAAASPQGASVQSLQTGVNMIYQQLKSTLLDTGLEEIDATNQKFDPNLHEALSEQESSQVPDGQVLQQVRKGYKLRDRLLRPAGVIVAKAPLK